MSPPEEVRWLFWEAQFDAIDLDRDADYVLARILEHGRLVDVQWLLKQYGSDRIRQFFREVGHPELSARTIAFWRALFGAEEETWQSPPSFRKSSAAPWVG